MLDTPWTLLSVIIAIAGSVWSLAWWLSGNFLSIRKDIYALEKIILDKLEYHERHDDTRFSQLRDDIWDIRIHNAAKDGARYLLPKIKED